MEMFADSILRGKQPPERALTMPVSIPPLESLGLPKK